MKMRRSIIKSPVFPMLLGWLLFLGVALPASAQENPEKAARQARKFMSEAEEAMEAEDFASAEAYYRQAIAKDPSNAAARYNLGNMYYEEEISGEAIQRHSQAGKIAEEKSLKHKSFHNQGNSFMDQKKYPEAIEAYKNALRNNPNDEETRYNLALAKKLWDQEKEGGGGKDDDQKSQGDQENQDSQNQQDQQQGDQGEQEQNDQGNPEKQQGEDGENKGQPEDEKEGEGEPKEEQQGEGDKPQEQQQPVQQQPQPGQLSPQQVKSLLEAMGNEEKKVQEKMNAEQVKGVPTRTDKDW